MPQPNTKVAGSKLMQGLYKLFAKSDVETLKSVEGALKELDAEFVEDLWEPGEMHANPTEEEIKTGPAEGARGGNAEKMVDQYSSPATQEGITRQYEEFNSMVKAMRTEMASVKSKVNAITSLIHTILSKAEDEEEEEKHEESEKATRLTGVKKALRKASVAISKAEESKEDEDDDHKEEAEKAKAALKSARDVLNKAEEDSEDEDEDKETEKARATYKSLKKRLEWVRKAKKGESFDQWAKEEEKEPAHEKAVNKSDTEEDDNQPDHADSDGNQAAKADLTAKVADMSIQDLMSIVAGGRGEGVRTPPSFGVIKGGKSKLEWISEQADAMPMKEAILVKSLVTHATVIQEGGGNPARFQADLKAAPYEVQQLFIETE